MCLCVKGGGLRYEYVGDDNQQRFRAWKSVVEQRKWFAGDVFVIYQLIRRLDGMDWS